MWHHHYTAYHHPAAGHWLAHTIVSAVIHGLIYGAIFRIMRGMSIPEVLLVAVVGFVVVGGGWWLISRHRGY